MAPTRPSPVRQQSSNTQSQSPVRKHPRRGLTLAQKQALIDNIQLEIAERARKLRAQYSLQANGLRTRLEIRVNRIPHRMRTQIMGATSDKFSNQRLSSTAILPGMAAPSPVKQKPTSKKPASSKRDSDEMENKENEELENPKKRVKAAPPPRAVSRTKKAEATQVLSPRSNNTNDRVTSAAIQRTQSPTKMEPPPPRSQLARPVSPVKSTHTSPTKGGASSMLSNMVNKAKAATAKATATKPATTIVRKTSTRKVTPKEPAAAPAPTTRKITAVPPPALRSTRSSLNSQTTANSGDSNKTAFVRKPSVKETMKEKATGAMGTLKRMGSKKKLAGADSDTEEKKTGAMGTLKRMTSREKKKPAKAAVKPATRSTRSKRA